MRVEGLKEQSDKDLVQRVLDGWTQAFDVLVSRWQRPLYNYLLRLTGDPEQARDTSQEAFLRAYTHLKELRDHEKFAAWLFHIGVNSYRSNRRSAPAHNVYSDDISLDEIDALPAEASREMQLTVRELVSGLPDEQREVLLLKVFHGFCFREIADIVGCPVSTVKSRLYKALQQLRTALECPTTPSRR
jgi:RNA polymerase sigma-70 factor (ECF subfamily)